MQKFSLIRTFFASISVILLFGCATTPYRSKFQCPGGYAGQCESIQQAYKDSIHNFDPRLYDEKWVKREKEWERKHAALIRARKQAGEDIKTIDERLKEHKKGSSTNETLYREKLFKELKDLLSEPEKPIVVPPKVVRVLVLSTLAKESRDREIFISPRYIFFMLDRPRWLLHKVDETVPFNSENPLIRHER